MEKLILSITNSNYLIENGGTEKFLRDYSSLLREKRFFTVTFFSITARLGNDSNLHFGAIENGKFLGIYNYKDMWSLICRICKENDLELHSINIHNVKDHDLGMLGQIIRDYNIPVVWFVHDFKFFCQWGGKIRKDTICGYEKPNDAACFGCEKYEGAKERYEGNIRFAALIYEQIRTIVVPSSYVEQLLLRAFPAAGDKIIVRSHLVFSGTAALKPVNGRIRLAYAGAQISAKGYDSWLRLVSDITKNCPEEYELFYLGYDTKKVDRVRNIYVSGANGNGLSMEKALKDNDIHCALYWTQLGETYCYVYYEMAVAGVYVITNKMTGNVYEEVAVKKNGRIFETFEECLRYFRDPVTVRKEINEYRKMPAFAPQESAANPMLVLPEAESIKTGTAEKVRKNRIYSLLYLIKHRLHGKREKQI